MIDAAQRKIHSFLVPFKFGRKNTFYKVCYCFRVFWCLRLTCAFTSTLSTLVPSVNAKTAYLCEKGFLDINICETEFFKQVIALRHSPEGVTMHSESTVSLRPRFSDEIVLNCICFTWITCVFIFQFHKYVHDCACNSCKSVKFKICLPRKLFRTAWIPGLIVGCDLAMYFVCTLILAFNFFVAANLLSVNKRNYLKTLHLSVELCAEITCKITKCFNTT